MIRTAHAGTVAALVILMAAGSTLTAACSTAPPTQEGKDDLVREAAAALTAWNREVPGVEAFARGSHAYALFPGIGKGGIGLGGAYGRGVVYAQGQHIGYADLSEGSLGLQLGGQSYQQLIVFDDAGVFDRFKQGRFALSADTSAVVIKPGYAASVGSIDGATVFFKPNGGLMGELVLAGQQLTFAPK